MDDDDFFKKHFSDVIPIKKVDRIRLKKIKIISIKNTYGKWLRVILKFAN